jgi:signal transduction histidine kinase
MLELVRQTELAQQRFVETARRSGQVLLGVINGVLDLSKIEAGKIEPDRSAFDLLIALLRDDRRLYRGWERARRRLDIPLYCEVRAAETPG